MLGCACEVNLFNLRRAQPFLPRSPSLEVTWVPAMQDLLEADKAMGLMTCAFSPALAAPLRHFRLASSWRDADFPVASIHCRFSFHKRFAPCPFDEYVTINNNNNVGLYSAF